MTAKCPVPSFFGFIFEPLHVSLQQLNSFYHHSGNGILQGDRYGNILNPDQQQQQHHQNFREIDFTEKSLVPPFPFPERPVNIASYIQPSVLNGGASTAIDSSWSTTQSALRRPWTMQKSKT